MEEQLISFETAKLAKEKGFIIKCEKVYGKMNKNIKNCRLYSSDNDNIIKECYAPTQSLLQKWLREKHNIHYVFDVYITDGTYCYKIIYTVDNIRCELKQSSHLPYLDYESALEHALNQGLNLIK